MNIEIRIFKGMESLSRDAASIFAIQAAKAIEERGRFLVVLNGGNTPNRFFQLLATDFHDDVDWRNTHVFWSDERCVPPDDPGSNFGQAMVAFLGSVQIPEPNIHRIKGELEPAKASKDYTTILKGFASPPLGFPRFDLVYLGLGEDGHTASLFPGLTLDVTKPVLPVTAHYLDRPANRVTLTEFAFNQSKRVVFMVTGEKKAATLAEVLSDRYDPQAYPAQRINPKNGRLIWLVDEDAAGKLPRELTRQFCEG